MPAALPPISAVTTGFASPGTDTHRIFRTVLDALARPGRIIPTQSAVEAPAPLFASAAEIVLALADFETTIWLDAPLASVPEVAAYLRFHTGSKIVDDPALAGFAVISDPGRMPPLTAFAQGTSDYPDRSTTLIVQSSRLAPAGQTFEGPGIDGRIMLSTEPGLPDLESQLARNRATFPCGVDLVFVTRSALAALPRSVRLVKG